MSVERPSLQAMGQAAARSLYAAGPPTADEQLELALAPDAFPAAVARPSLLDKAVERLAKRPKVGLLPGDYRVMVGGAVAGNAGALSVGTSEDLVTLGTRPGLRTNADGAVTGYRAGVRGTLASEHVGLWSGGSKGRMRVGYALGVERYTWWDSWRFEAVGGQAFADNLEFPELYVGGRVSYAHSVGRIGLKLGTFTQVDYTLRGVTGGTQGLVIAY